jgi:hypothetical protein
MKIKIVSNVVLPGLEGKETMEFKEAAVSLRTLLARLDSVSSGRIRVINPLNGEIDHMAFDIRINDSPNRGTPESLEMGLGEGDVVTVNLLPLGGG